MHSILYKQTNKNRNLTNILGVIVLSTIAITGCSKPKNTENVDTDTASTGSVNTERVDETKVDDAEPKKPAESEPVIACDDQVAVTQLIQSVRSSVNQLSQNLLSSYANRAEIPVDLSSTNSSISSMLVDVANPTLVQSQNASGMVTCKSSLSLTLPTKDMHQARSIYDNLGGDSLQQRMMAQNLSLNNNMLVSSAFTYVVGMQGGQATARVVGQPPILRAVADIIAKSKFKVASDIANPAPPASPSSRSEPTSPSEPEQPQFPSDPSATKQTEKSTENEDNSNNDSENDKNNSQSTQNNTENDLNASSQQDTKSEFEVPTDDSIDMVIVEEEGTY